MQKIDFERIKDFWAQRSSLSRADFFADFLSHPDIPQTLCEQIFTFISQGSSSIFDFSQFISAIAILDDPDKEWPGGVDRQNFAKLSTDFTFGISQHEVIAGVTHFEVEEIAWIEERFAEQCNQQTWSIPEPTFVSCMFSRLRRMDVAQGIYRVFSEQSAIGFKEFVCGLSSLCRGPDVERLKSVARIWDSDMDGILSTKELANLFEYFQFALGVKNGADWHSIVSYDQPIIEFVCLAIANPVIKQAFISLSDQIWVILTSKDWRDQDRQVVGSNGRNNSLTSSPSTPARTPLAGILNVGNTCYMGSALQSLSNVAPLTGFVLSREQCYSRWPLLQNYAKLLCSLFVHKQTASPRALKDIISKRTPLFESHCQHDSQEFIQFFLDALHNDLNEANERIGKTSREENGQDAKGDDEKDGMREMRNKDEERGGAEEDELIRNGEDGDGRSRNVEENASIWQEATKKWNDEVVFSRKGSIVLDLFAGQLLSQLHCPSCQNSSFCFDLFTVLQLPIPISDFVLIFIKLLRHDRATITRLAFRVSSQAKLSHLKDLISEQIGVDSDRLITLIFSKSDGKFNPILSRIFDRNVRDQCMNGDDCVEDTMKGIPIADLDIWCVETKAAPRGTHHLICVHRRFYMKRVYAVRELDGIASATFGVPIVLTFPSNVQSVTASELYTRILESVHWRYLSSGKGPNRGISNNRALDAGVDSLTNRYPFELAITKNDAIWCHKCDWRRFCRGCPLEGGDQLELPLVADSCLLTINWHNVSALYLLYNNLVPGVEDKPGMMDCARVEPQALNIGDCLDDFTREERILDSQCEKCKSPRGRTKQLWLARLPPILIINFKRFIFLSTHKRFAKQLSPISFPLDNFDPSDYFSPEVPASCKSDCSHYNCIAIVTHQGQLNYGHYCTFLRDSSDSWYFCNDDRTYAIEKSEVDTRNAYMVIYQREGSRKTGYDQRKDEDAH